MGEEDTAIFHGGDAVRFTVIVFLGRLWQTGQKIGISAGVALTVLEGVVERGEKLEPQLDSRIVVSYFADAFERLPSRKYAKLRAPEVTSKTFDDTMMPASKSSGVQCLSESRVARLM